jgi:hypothetical protein
MSGQPPIPTGGFLRDFEVAAEALVGIPGCEWFGRAIEDVVKGRARGLDEAMSHRGCHRTALDVERRARRDAALCDIWRRDYPGLSAKEASRKIDGDLRRYGGVNWPTDFARGGVLPRDLASARHRLCLAFSSGAPVPTSVKHIRRILEANVDMAPHRMSSRP